MQCSSLGIRDWNTAEWGGGWKALIWREGGFQLEEPTKVVSGKTFQGSGHLGLICLPRKVTLRTLNGCYVMGTLLRAPHALSQCS